MKKFTTHEMITVGVSLGIGVLITAVFRLGELNALTEVAKELLDEGVKLEAENEHLKNVLQD